jgi:hypothetical protein
VKRNSHLTKYGQTLSQENLAKILSARELQGKLGAIPGPTLAQLLQSGNLISNVKPAAARATNKVLGPSTSEIKAKAQRQVVSLRKVEDDHKIISRAVSQELHADVFQIGNMLFVTAVVVPMQLIMAEVLKWGKAHEESYLMQTRIFLTYSEHMC